MKILLLEDEPKVAAFIIKGLEAHMLHVDHVATGPEAERQAALNEYDLMILDVMVPGKSGIEVCKAIRKENTQVPILLLTALDATDDKVRGLDAGADDYLAKPFDFAELVARIRALLRRNTPGVTGAVLQCGDLQMDLTGKTVTRNGKSIRLTAREFSLLEHLMRNQGRVVSRVDIVERVWDKSFDTGTNTVDVYINLLRKKVDKDFDRPLIHTVTGMGYMLKNEEAA
jgi:DNA-binding response OmpR family regulator